MPEVSSFFLKSQLELCKKFPDLMNSSDLICITEILLFRLKRVEET